MIDADFNNIMNEIFNDIIAIETHSNEENVIKNKAIIAIRVALAKRNMSNIIG